MSDLNQAVNAAKAFLAKAVPDSDGVQVEEVELSDDDSTCFITLSYLRPRPKEDTWDPLESVRDRMDFSISAFSKAAEHLEKYSYERVYRRFDVKGNVVRSMTIREFASA